jgi:hypothetical protein
VGQLANCYGDEWLYYSIDQCLNPATSNTSSALPANSTNAALHATPDSKINAGVVVGAVMSVLGCFVFGLLGLFVSLRRKRATTSSPSPLHELPDDRALAESAAMEKHEMWADGPAVEIGRNSIYEETHARPPVNPTIRIWWVR